jgi:FG-GAP-like repeat
MSTHPYCPGQPAARFPVVSSCRCVARGAVLLLFLAVNVGWAEPVVLSRQVITLPANAGAPLFVDIEGNGRCNLLVIDTVEKKLLNYRQRPDGFTNSPDQVIPLPPQTAWAAPCDVDAHPGLELLMSTATGLFYYRQNAGLFESERHPLIEVSQVFTNYDLPTLTLLNTNKAGTNDLIPVISAGQAVLYHRNSAYEWSPGPPLALDVKQTAWHVNRYLWRDLWALGPNSAHSLDVEQSFRTQPEPARDKEPENEVIRKIIADMKKNAAASPPQLDRVDMDGDGREDLALWQAGGKLDFKTDVYIFLRGADQKLPEQPTQVLHCRGFPIPIGSTWRRSPVHDLDGDGVCELVLLEIKTRIISESGLVEMVVSHGLDWALTIRSFHHGVFSRSPDASELVKGILPSEVLAGWPFLVQGDFNGDGRLDLLVRRSDTQWNIFTSTTDGHWFAPQPAMTFDVPTHGYIEIQDLNGDGLSDIIWHEWDKPNLSIFMSPPRQAKDKNP